jgi:hypothetical protein
VPGETGDLVERLMGKKPELRFQYIQENARFVEELAANYSIKYDVHLCAILGRMLGLTQEIQQIETFDYPELNSTSDPSAMLEFSLTLENWVYAARDSVAMDEITRRKTWNLECVGRLGIPKSAFVENSEPNATFRKDGTTVFVYGDIDFGFFERFASFLEANPGVKKVSLGSGGGSVRDAMLTGHAIRKLGLSTTIHGNCFSACPIVFVGGVERTLFASPNRLGFHQVATGNGRAVPFGDPTYDAIADYFLEMGVDPNTVISWMQSAAPDGMFEPDVSALCDPNVATFVQRICGW